MKNLRFRLALVCLSLFSLVFSNNAWSQAPEKFNYQAVVRNASGEIIASSSVSMRIAILSGSSTGTEVFAEEHALTTNDFGLVNFQIGGGSNQTGSIASIDWGANSYFVAVELDATGGTNYSATGTAQLLSVPYALYAKSASVDNVDDADATNELQTLTPFR